MSSQYGLIGYPLGHSFSKAYFTEKFQKFENSNTYDLFELTEIGQFTELVQSNKLSGLNVTIPYKQKIIPYLNSLDQSAQLVGAVNVIKFVKGNLVGFNSDYPAFRTTLKKWLDNTNIKALVLGSGGASKAVITALSDLEIQHQQVSRTESKSTISYETLWKDESWLQNHKLIINATPLGMTPNIDKHPNIPYSLLNETHYLYDLVYNPLETNFLKQGNLKECKTKNGLEMLHLQAELAWDIWNS